MLEEQDRSAVERSLIGASEHSPVHEYVLQRRANIGVKEAVLDGGSDRLVGNVADLQAIHHLVDHRICRDDILKVVGQSPDLRQEHP